MNILSTLKSYLTLALIKPRAYFADAKNYQFLSVLILTIGLLVLMTGLLFISNRLSHFLISNLPTPLAEGARIPLFIKEAGYTRFLYPITWTLIVGWAGIFRFILARVVIAGTESGLGVKSAMAISMVSYWPMMILGAIIGMINDLFPSVGVEAVESGYIRILIEIVLLVLGYAWQLVSASMGIKENTGIALRQSIAITLGPDAICCFSLMALITANVFLAG